MVKKGEKTCVWNVKSKKWGDRLGTVKWFGRWRQYTFYPEPDTVFNTECLSDIAKFLFEIMLDRAAKDRPPCPECGYGMKAYANGYKRCPECGHEDAREMFKK